jgi:hypothetical protein
MNCLLFASSWVPLFYWGCVVIFPIFRIVFFYLLVFLVLFCVLFPRLRMSLDCPFLIASSVFSNAYILNIVCWCPTHIVLCSLFCFCLGPVSCVPNVACFSGLSFMIAPSVYSNVSMSLVCLFLIAPSVFSNKVFLYMYLNCPFLIALSVI